MRTFYDTPADMHPYECNGPGLCIHCDRRFDEDIHMNEHDPATCALCDPDYDGQPNPHWTGAQFVTHDDMYSGQAVQALVSERNALRRELNLYAERLQKAEALADEYEADRNAWEKVAREYEAALAARGLL